MIRIHSSGDKHWLSPGETVALVGSLFLVGLTFGGSSPLIAAILEQRGHNEYFTGSVTAVLSLALAVASPAVGRWVHSKGARLVNVAGIVGQAVGFVLLAIALRSSALLLFPARAWLGVCAAATFVAAEYVLVRRTPASYRARVLAFYGAGFSSGFALGIFASSKTYDRYGETWLVVLAGATLLIAPLAWWSMRRLPVQDELERVEGARLDWRLLSIAIYGAVAYGVFDMAITGTYPIEGQRLGFEPAQTLGIVACMAAGSVVGQPVAGWMADRWGNIRLMTALCILTAVAATGAGVASTSEIPDSKLVTVAFTLVGATMGGMYPVGLALLGERSTESELSRANAVFVAAFGYTSLVAPFVGAGLVDAAERTGLTGWAVPTLTIVTCLAAGPLLWREYRR